jgi:peptidoglycan/LPS O-acetylase OafA/YrhL
VRGASGPAQLTTAPSSGIRLAGVEGLRALAATSIVLVHVWGFSTPGGALGSRQWIGDALSTLSVGVTLFFTLSGFLLYRPFAASIARGEPYLPIRAYLRNRVLRIAPAYLVILVLATLVLDAGNVRHAGVLTVGRLTDPAGLLQAGLLLQDYRPATMVIGIGPAWSLAVEVVFYCVLPLLVLAAARIARLMNERRARVLVLLGPPLLLLLVGLSGKYAAAHLLPGSPTAGFRADWHSVIERSFWAQADLFSFGMVVAVLHTEVTDGRLALSRHWRRAAVALGLLVFVPCAWTMHQGEQSYLVQNTGEALGIALVFAAIMIPGPGTRPLRTVRLLESRPLVAVGIASFSVFLWHHPVIMWLSTHGLTVGGRGGLLVNLIVVALIVGVLSALTYRFIERPALRRKRSTRKATAPASDPRGTRSIMTALGGWWVAVRATDQGRDVRSDPATADLGLAGRLDDRAP